MLYIEPVGGLCNRMRALNSAIFLTKEVKTPLTLLWQTSWDLGCPVSKLFELPSFIKIIDYAPPDNPALSLMSTVDRVIEEEELSGLKRQNFNAEELFRPERQIYIKTCGSFYPYAHFNYFKPVSDLQQVIDHYVASFGSNVIGVHIRRSDNDQSILHSSTQAFIQAMDLQVSVNPEVRFFLATDSPEEEAALGARYGHRVIIYSKEFRRDSEKSIQDALIDLYCLANTRILFASYWSSFSDIAAEIKGIEKIVIYH